MTDYGIDTLALHAGHTPDQETLSRAVPLYQTSSFVFRDTEHAAGLFALRQFGNIYTRLMNPTTDVLEKRLAAIHGATGAVATASGQAAIFYSIAAITSAGQNFVTGDKLYGGTYTQFRVPLKRFGIGAVSGCMAANAAGSIPYRVTFRSPRPGVVAICISGTAWDTPGS